MHKNYRATPSPLLHVKNLSLGFITAVVAFSAWFVVSPASVNAAACATPTTNLGSGTMNVSVPATGTYRVWSRIMASDATNNSYSLEVDGANCYVVGDSQISANVWTWADYQGGVATSKISLNLTAGTHSLKLVGREANVKVDRVILASDINCVPTGTGDNCAVNPDLTPPVVALTAPATNTTVSGNVSMTATATDADGIAKVEFYVDSVLKATVATAPYVYSWNTMSLSNGSHTLMAKAFDKIGNTSADSIVVTVKNGDAQIPSTPTSLTATASGPTTVDLKWTASTDNISVTGYYVQRSNVTLAQVGSTTTYKDTMAVAGTTYSYRIIAFDAVGNQSQPSTSVNVTTPKPPTADTQAPTVPSGVSATAVSPAQVNLAWSASADNIGVAKYHIYRSTAGGSASEVATSTTTSLGNTGLNAATTYNYYVTAEDAAGNVSTKSTTVSATTATQPTTVKATIIGKITGRNGGNLGDARAVIWVNGNRKVYQARYDGTYAIPQLSAGTYRVKYASYNYYPQTSSITVTTGQTVTKNVSLTRR